MRLTTSYTVNVSYRNGSTGGSEIYGTLADAKAHAEYLATKGMGYGKKSRGQEIQIWKHIAPVLVESIQVDDTVVTAEQQEPPK